MKKELLFALALGVSLVACDKDDDKNEVVDPQGQETSFVDINSGNVKNWTAYATRVATLLKSDANSLYNAWADSYNGEPYAETFKKHNGNSYTSSLDCLQEIVQGCADIANEVGTAKIGEPYDFKKAGKDNEALYAVESWFSWHSRDDYSNNILSIRNSFFGSLDGKEAENSLATYIKGKDADLYAKINSAISDAYKAIQDIPQPFRNNIVCSETDKAMEACASLEKLLNSLSTWLEENEDEAVFDKIAVSYVDKVVVPTYKSLVDKVDALLTAVKAVEANPSEKTFATAAEAWLNAREPWETSEAFLFGPVADLGLDPNMDSWPLDQADIQNLIEKGTFESLDWSGDFDEDNADIEAAQTVRGFHTLEYLIFKDGKARVY